MWLHSVMMTFNYCTSPISSSRHGTEPAVLWKNSQNSSYICFAETVAQLCILDFFKLSTAICIQAATIVWWNSCKPSMSVIILCSKAMHFTISTTCVNFCFNGFVQNPPLWSTNSKSPSYSTSCTQESVIKYCFTSVWCSSAVWFH